MVQRARPESCLSDLAIDRLIAGELAGDARSRADDHLAGCATCARRRDELAADTLDDVWVARAVTRAAAATARPRRKLAVAVAIAAPLAAAAALVIWFALPRQPAGEVQTKGGLAIEIAVKRGDATPILGADARVAPGESIRFLISADRAGYLAILGVDSTRRVSRYLPDPGAAMPSIAVGSRQAQPGGFTLDDAPGAERFVAILCDAPIDLDELVRATQQAIATLRDPRELERIPTACAQASFVVEKAP